MIIACDYYYCWEHRPRTRNEMKPAGFAVSPLQALRASASVAPSLRRSFSPSCICICHLSGSRPAYIFSASSRCLVLSSRYTNKTPSFALSSPAYTDWAPYPANCLSTPFDPHAANGFAYPLHPLSRFNSEFIIRLAGGRSE